MCLFTCSVSTIVVANIAKSWTLHHALHAGHWLYCIFLTWSHSSWTGYYFVTSAMQILMFDLFWVKQFMLFSLFGDECYSQNELDGSTSWCYLLFSNFVHVWVHASEWKLLHLETRWHYKPFLWMWVLTTLVKVSNFTNEVYDLHYVSSIIAEAINCSEFWTHSISHLILV